MTVARPRVFVSSTIHDFADLRDALKFWLEEMGFEVQMSEHTDFERRPEAGTFDACFESIRESDYYVLLIGYRRGSSHDETNGVSVTQQEYRTACDSLVRIRKPRLVAFVRRDVLTVLRDRQKSQAAPSSGSILEDAEFTTAFVREVRREEETARAVAGEGPYPAGNWLTEFAGFRELTDALRSSLRIRGPLPKVALLETLRHELARNLRMFMMNYKGNPFYHHFWLDKEREQVRIERAELNEELWLEFDQLKRLRIYVSAGPAAPDTLVRSALDQAILSGTLLNYDTDQGGFIPSLLLKALYRLREEVDTYSARYRGLHEDKLDVARLWGEAGVHKRGANVSAMTLLSVFCMHDSEQDVVRNLIAILRYLYEYTEDIEVMGRPISALVGEDERIKGERVSEEQMQNWLAEDNVLLRMGTTDVTEEQR